MAHIFRIVLTVFSKERTALYSFLDGLLVNGWAAHVPVSQNHDSETLALWGGFWDPSMRILTAAGTTDVGDTRYLPSFSKKDVQAEAQRHCGTQIPPYINDETFPGFLPPCSGDAIAVIIAESTYSIPYLWLSTVIDKYYDQGLRFLVKCHDPLNLNADGKAYSDVLYSVPSDAAPTKYSQHCVCLTDRGVMQDGDYDEDLYLPMIDDEGNELTSPTHSLL